MSTHMPTDPPDRTPDSPLEEYERQGSVATAEAATSPLLPADLGIDRSITGGSLPPRAVELITIGVAILTIVVIVATDISAIPVVLAAFALALGSVYIWSRIVEGRRKAADRAVTITVTAAFLLALLPLVSVLYTVIDRGAARFDDTFFTDNMRNVIGDGGGAYHAIIGTLIITLCATVISVPIGIMAAIYLNEYGRGPLKRWLTFFVDVMTGIPSIVAGLFAYALFVLFFGEGVRMGIGGSVALSVLMIPVVVRSSEEMLKLVPNELREASYALGVPKWRTVAKVVLPTALAGIVTGVTLSIARVIGETAPLLIIVGITDSVNFNLFDGRMSTLPVFAYASQRNPGIPPEFSLDRAWGAALVLLMIVMLLNLIARLVSHFFSPKGER
jgi:phosphate transport system permease protein